MNIMDYSRILWVKSNENHLVSMIHKGLSQVDVDIITSKAIELDMKKVMDKIISLGTINKELTIRLASMNGTHSMIEFLLSKLKCSEMLLDSAFLITMHDQRFNEALLFLPFISIDYFRIFFYYVKILFRYKRFRRELEKKAAKKIYFWWIPICYDHNREVGQRMMHKSWTRFKAL